MDTVAQVLDVEQDGSIKVDLGGENPCTAEHYADSGVDAPPLPGDYVALGEGPGSGELQVTGYDDLTTKQAANGERRTYGRAPDGTVVAEIWIKGDGSVEVTSLVAGGAKVVVQPTGAVEITGTASISQSLAVAGAGDWVAMAAKVLTELNDIRAKFDSHTHVTTATIGATATPGVIAPPTPPMGTANSVASTTIQGD